MPAKFIRIKTVEELADLFGRSHRDPVVLFKHSNSCGISSGVYRIISEIDADLNLIVVQDDRSVSDAVVELTSVRHESPQAIVIKDGAVVYHASHYDITPEDIAVHLKASERPGL